MLQHSMEYCSFLLYKLTSVLRRAREYKKRHGSFDDPCRRDIAPTGELAGLPARDAPKTLIDSASLDMSEAGKILPS